MPGRLRKNVVAMVALGVIVLLVLFAFVGPMLVPYGYDQFNAGAENLYPWHYSLEAQQAYKEATSSQDPDEAVAAAEAGGGRPRRGAQQQGQGAHPRPGQGRRRPSTRV